MIAYCSLGVDVAMGNAPVKRSLFGYIFVPFFKRSFYDASELAKSSPTATEFIITDDFDFEKEKQLLIEKEEIYLEAGHENCKKEPNAFFGRLAAEQTGVGMYNHIDHHLRQFGA